MPRVVLIGKRIYYAGPSDSEEDDPKAYTPAQLKMIKQKYEQEQTRRDNSCGGGNKNAIDNGKKNDNKSANKNGNSSNASEEKKNSFLQCTFTRSKKLYLSYKK